MNLYIEDMSKFFDYWRFLRITEDAFIKQAEVGDLILCSSKNKVNIPRVRQEVQRGQTMVQHLCLVVKLETGVPSKKKDEVFIIRIGTSLDQGVVIQSWEEFRIYKAQKYNDCWFRHLYCDRDDEFLQKTQNFIQKVREKPFLIKKADPKV